MDDLISRQAVLDLLQMKYFGKELYMAIYDLPPVKPQEPKTGHWFVDERPESDREIICSNCEQPIFKYHKIEFDYRPKYCPNCGARLEQETKTGHWIDADGDNAICGCCNRLNHLYGTYCKHCGAKMD